MKNKFKYTGPLLFFTLICILIVIVDIKGTEYLLSTIPKIPYGDKLGHFFIFGLLGLMVNNSLNSRRIRWLHMNCFLGSMLVFGFAVLEEFSQIFLSNRSFDLLDISADLTGIWLFSKLRIKELLTWLGNLVNRPSRSDSMHD